MVKKNLTSSIVVVAIGLIAGCNGTDDKNFLGSSVVEVQTYQSATTAQGMIVSVLKEEGQAVEKGELIAVIDTVPLVLQLKELRANLQQLNRQIQSKQSEIGVVRNDVEGVKREKDRLSGLVEKGSAPQQQLDNLETQYRSGTLKTKSADMALEALEMQREALLARESLIADNIRKCYVRSVCKGTVLTRFKSEGEVASPAAPLFELGAFDSVQVDFFVPQPMLSSISAGQEVRIRVDREPDAKDKKKEQFIPARVAWISDQAEFSPKNIQTRESRNELVFMVRAKAANENRMLKRGLPVEVWR